MGVFPEDSVIDVSELIRLWVAEGFLKPISGKCLELVAKEYFNDLVARNLILVHERGYTGETIKCKVHDVLVYVCVREAQKHKFLCVASHHNFSNPQNLNTQRRIVVHGSTKPEVICDWLSHHGTVVRSLTTKRFTSFPTSFNLRLLRVWNGLYIGVRATFPRIVNCRYIFSPSLSPTLPSSIFTLWNLQTLYVRDAEVATSHILNMSQLRHVLRVDLLDHPPSGHANGGGDDFVLGNLQTLSRVVNFKFSEDVVKRIRNLKELTVYYTGIMDWSSCCLNNLVQLINLESLDFTFRSLEKLIPSELHENLSFPRSLKELRLKDTKLDWGELGTKIGSLPHLQVLKLEKGFDSFVGAEWKTVEGQFRSLKYLEMVGLDNLRCWRTESWTHFPCLERLFLKDLKMLEEIPSEIGETLKSIEIFYCSDSTIFSAKEILTEQESLGNEGLQVNVKIGKRNNPDVESLASPNFQIKAFKRGSWE